MTINEIRSMASLPPVDGGDVTRDQQATNNITPAQ
jgi:hypothetical protein